MSSLALAKQVLKRNSKRHNSGRLHPDAVDSIPDLLRDRFGEGNCWGTTLFTLGYQALPEFIPGDQMNRWLSRNTRRVLRPAFGDVLVMRYSGSEEALDDGDDLSVSKNGFIRHTAVYVGGGLYWHQIGYGGPYAIDTLAKVKAHYPGGVVYHVRVK